MKFKIKMNKKIIRTISGLVVFTVFALMFIVPGGLFVPLATAFEFMQIGPLLIQIIASFSVTALAVLTVLLIITFLTGRVYCSFLCPLGIFQDLVRLLNRKRKNNSYRNVSPLIRYTVLGVSLFLLLFGITNLFLYFDPYANFGRISTTVFRNMILFVQNGLVWVLNSFKIYDIQQGIYLPATIISTIFVLSVFVLVTVLAFRFGRLYCNTLCPVGALLGLISKHSFLSIQFNNKCTECGRCETICKSECINVKKQYVDKERCVMCFDCEAACPVSGISLSRIKSKKPLTPFSASRKNFLKTGGYISLGVLAFASIPLRKFVKPLIASNGKEKGAIIPPGAGSLALYSEKCIGCHLCTAACQMNIIRPATTELGLKNTLQPVLDYTNGFCSYGCNDCTQVCPVDAIRPLDIKTKQRTKIGQAHFDSSECVVHKNGEDCGACAEVCPTTAIKMKRYGGKSLAYPELDPELCIGCGACNYSCPTDPKSFTVIPVNPQTLVAAREDDGEGPRIDNSEFPF